MPNPRLFLLAVLLLGAAAPQTLVLDLDADHHLDTIVLTQTLKQIEITVTYGDPRYPSEILRFPVNPAIQDAVCAVPVTLKREKAHGFLVADNKCDSLHFSFNRKTNKIQWWRL